MCECGPEKCRASRPHISRTSTRYSTTCCRAVDTLVRVPWENSKVCVENSPLDLVPSTARRRSQCFVVDFIFTYLACVLLLFDKRTFSFFHLPSSPVRLLVGVLPPPSRWKVWGLFCYCCCSCCFFFIVVQCCIVPFYFLHLHSTQHTAKQFGAKASTDFFKSSLGSFLQLFMWLKHRRVFFVHDSRKKIRKICSEKNVWYRLHISKGGKFEEIGKLIFDRKNWKIEKLLWEKSEKEN